jgi:hypothetical protein
MAIKGPNKANPLIIGNMSWIVFSLEAHNHRIMPIKGYRMMAKK